jgi:hypothetical protein
MTALALSINETAIARRWMCNLRRQYEYWHSQNAQRVTQGGRIRHGPAGGYARHRASRSARISGLRTNWVIARSRPRIANGMHCDNKKTDRDGDGDAWCENATLATNQILLPPHTDDQTQTWHRRPSSPRTARSPPARLRLIVSAPKRSPVRWISSVVRQ